MNQIVSSVQAEYLRYKGLAEGAIAQLSDADLVVSGPGNGNSIAGVMPGPLSRARPRARSSCQVTRRGSRSTRAAIAAGSTAYGASRLLE